MTDTLTLPFGLSEAVPADAKVAWGARLIITANGHVDFLADRQGCAGDESLRDDLLNRLQAIAPLNELIAKIREHLLDRSIDTRRSEQIVLVDDCGLKVVADSKASAGYLYLAAFRTDAAMDTQAALA